MSKPGVFFDTDIWKKASQNLCTDGWPHVVILVNQEVGKLREQNTKLQAALDVAVKALNYYPDNCDACNFSGVDEAEFSARGCPSCDCLIARQALAEIKGE